MGQRAAKILVCSLHGLVRTVAFLAFAGGLLLCIAAYGIPGAWVQSRLDAALGTDALRLTVKHIAFRPRAGLILQDANLYDAASGRRLAGFSRGAFGLRLFASGTKRLRSATVEDLFVAQIDHSVPSDPDWRFPDLSKADLPDFREVALRFVRPDVLEVRLDAASGTLDAEDGVYRFHGLRGKAGADEAVEGEVALDLRQGVVTAALRGFVDHARLHGIYRALDFPVLEKYSRRFALDAPAWGDATFTVGLDKYRNLFDLSIHVISQKGGAYDGVPFDEGEGVIRCKGVWDAVTEIGPIVARRGGRVAATGSLRFDCPEDRLAFRVDSAGLFPGELLRLIDLPFTDALPLIVCQTPPAVSFEGSFPFLGEQRPDAIALEGRIDMPAGGVMEDVPFASASAAFSMADGVLSVRDATATLQHGGSLDGQVSLAIAPSAEYADLEAQLLLGEAALSDLLRPFDAETLTNCAVSGTLALKCRTDATLAESLSADYDLVVDGGLIGRLRLFAGLTDFISEHVPGVSAITDSNVAYAKGFARDGVFSIPKFSLTGDLFSVEGPVLYSLPEDRLDALLTAGLFKRNSAMGVMTRWAMFPVANLLGQFQVTGPLADPKWEMVTVVEKLWNVSTGEGWTPRTVEAPKEDASKQDDESFFSKLLPW